MIELYLFDFLELYKKKTIKSVKSYNIIYHISFENLIIIFQY